MEVDDLTPPEAHANGNHQPLPLLPEESRPRPYQAYCVTEASSRPSSPDGAIPSPLCLQVSSIEDRKLEPFFPPDASLAQSPATRVQEDGGLAISPKRELGSNEKQETSNANLPTRNTELVSGDHITQAVTPRGSHSLVGIQTPMYDRTPSQLRMQPSVPSYVATSKAYQRNPLPQSVSHAEMDRHPLPPLPVEPIVNLDHEKPGVRLDDVLSVEEDLEPIPQELQRSSRSSQSYQSTERFPTTKYGKEDLYMPLQIETDISNHSQILRKSVTFHDELRSPISKVYKDDVFISKCDGDTRKPGLDNEHAQSPSLKDLYGPHGILEESNDDRQAHRRTQPKDAKLKYQFGRRPSVTLDLPPPLPLHRHSPQFSIQPQTYDTAWQLSTEDYFPPYSPSLSFQSFPDTQAGPRPPPWISHDNLEMQRRIRGEAREREEVRKYRMTLDTASSHSLRKGSGSSDFGESLMRREVEEYREQVLALYPDMELDGYARKDGREWRCCCVVM